MSLAISTFGDLITMAFKTAGILGVGQTLSAEDSNDGAKYLSMMIAQWQRSRYLIYHLIDVVFQSTGAQSYTVGPGGNFAVATRPASIKSAFARQQAGGNPNQIDYPITILPSREDYNLIALKTLSSFPGWAWYDAAMPLGSLYLYPVVSSGFELHITVEAPLQTITNLADAITLPPEYQEAILYNLTARLCIGYGIEIPGGVAALARSSLNTLRKANAQIPRMRMPTTVLRDRLYNIYSDQSY